MNKIIQPKLNIQKQRQLIRLASEIKIATLINSLENIKLKKLVRTKKDTNKGDFGSVAIIGGNKGMHGSLYLAGRAAMQLGSGKVSLASLDANFSTDLIMPELMLINPKDVLKQLDVYPVIVVGPGLGQDDKSYKIIDKILQLQPTNQFIFDADGLNLLATHAKWHFKFRTLPHKIITPHPKEASRLLGVSLNEIQANRVVTIKKLSEYYNATTLLKGYASLIYDGKELFINPTGNPGMSNAGQGDTLCGFIAAFIAQGLDLSSALRLGVYLHGLSGDQLARDFSGYIGILASDITVKARLLLNQLLFNA
jgi:ADP-dependent NAD(P)H-hydrate dehydratase / NAD(P)H-hydrate epimerase